MRLLNHNVRTQISNRGHRAPQRPQAKPVHLPGDDCVRGVRERQRSSALVYRAKDRNSGLSNGSARRNRGTKWDDNFIPCKYHPDRRANKAAYVNRRVSRCGSCKHRRVDGSLRPCRLRDTMYKSLKNRRKYGTGTQSMSVLQIAERIIGGPALYPRR